MVRFRETPWEHNFPQRINASIIAHSTAFTAEPVCADHHAKGAEKHG